MQADYLKDKGNSTFQVNIFYLNSETPFNS